MTTAPAGSVAALRSPAMTTAVPPAAPVAPPTIAPFLPPISAPRIAPPTAAPPILRALSPAGDSPSRMIVSVRIGSCAPSASTSVWKRTPSRARSFTLPPRSTIVTAPSARVPAGMAVRPSTATSRMTRASTRSSTRARLGRNRGFDAQADHRRRRHLELDELACRRAAGRLAAVRRRPVRPAQAARSRAGTRVRRRARRRRWRRAVAAVAGVRGRRSQTAGRAAGRRLWAGAARDGGCRGRASPARFRRATDAGARRDASSAGAGAEPAVPAARPPPRYPEPAAPARSRLDRRRPQRRLLVRSDGPRGRLRRLPPVMQASAKRTPTASGFENILISWILLSEQ